MKSFALTWAVDRAEFTLDALRQAIADRFSLTDDELSFRKKGPEPLFQNGVSWIVNDWKAAGICKDVKGSHKKRDDPYRIERSNLSREMLQRYLIYKEDAIEQTASAAFSSHEIDVPTAIEGTSVQGRLHADSKRSQAIVAQKLAENKQRYNGYRCEDCNYAPANDTRITDWIEGYVSDDLMRGILDVHHKNPISDGERETTLGDLRVLCPLCHRRRHICGKL